MKRNYLSQIMKMAHRFFEITGKVWSECLKKAWANFKLLRKLQEGIVKFYFQKVDGSIREAWGTLNENIIPETSGDNRKKNDTVQVYFDTEKKEFRCFKKLNLIA